MGFNGVTQERDRDFGGIFAPGRHVNFMQHLAEIDEEIERTALLTAAECLAWDQLRRLIA